MGVPNSCSKRSRSSASPAGGTRRCRRRRCRRPRSRRSTPRRRSAVSALASWHEGDVAEQHDRRRARDEGHAERRRHHAVDAVGAAVGVGPRRPGRRTTRGRGPASTRRPTSSAPAGRRRGDRCGRRPARSARACRPSTPVDAPLGGGAGRRPRVAPASRRRRAAATAAVGSASTRDGDDVAVGVDRRRVRRPARRARRWRRATGRAPSTPAAARGGRPRRGDARRRSAVSRSIASNAGDGAGESTQPDIGSASTGHPVGAASAATASAVDAAAPAGDDHAARRAAASPHRRRRRRRPGAAPDRGRRAVRRRRRQRAGRCRERLAERQVEVHRAGRPRPRTAAGGERRATSRARRPSGTPGSWNQRTERAEQVGLVDGLRRADAAQLRRPVGGDARASARRTGRPRRRRGGSSPPRSRSCTAAAPGDPSRPRPRATNAADPLVVDDVDRAARRERRAPAPSACCASPGRRRRGATPRRTHSSTSVAQNVACTSAARLASRRHRPPGRYGAYGGAMAVTARIDAPTRPVDAPSRSGPTSSARGATSASGGFERALDHARRRPGSTSTSTSSTGPFQLDPTAPPGRSDAGRRGLRQQVRRPRAGDGDHRQRHRGSPPTRASSSTSTGPCGPTPADAHRLLWWTPSDHGAGRRRRR